jgi:hypothetical protein
MKTYSFSYFDYVNTKKFTHPADTSIILEPVRGLKYVVVLLGKESSTYSGITRAAQWANTAEHKLRADLIVSLGR